MMNVNPEDCRIQNINNNDILKHKKKLNKKQSTRLIVSMVRDLE